MSKDFALIKRPPFIPRTDAEAKAGVVPVAFRYPELDVRRYGAVGDWSSATDTDGQVATVATDNLSAFDDAILVAAEKGGGVISVIDGDYYVSDTIDAKSVSNLYVYVAPGTTVRATKFTSTGTLLALGHVGPVGTTIDNVGVFGGGTLRTFRPDHATVPAHAVLTAYDVGDYVLSTDTNGNERAYYCKTAGTTGAASPPDVINGSDTDGTVVWQDADNDNIIGAAADGVLILGMDLPSASGKFITCQTPSWKAVKILYNRCGGCNDKGIEVKGNTGTSGQEAAFGDGVQIVGNSLEETGYEGIEVEQSTFSSALNQNAALLNNLVRSAGAISSTAAFRVNRCANVEIRGNKALESSGNGYHIRLCQNVTGDLHTENAGGFGVHLQENSGWSFEAITVINPTDDGVRETDDAGGGHVGRLVITSGAADGWATVSRDGPAPTIANHSIDVSGTDLTGSFPILLMPETGSWTPVLTFETPGNLSVAYTTQSGEYVKQGRDILVHFNVVTSSFTHTSASGNLRITGLPATVAGSSWRGSVQWGGITKANYTQVVPVALVSTTRIEFRASGSGQAPDDIDTGDLPTGGTVTLIGSILYRQELA